MPHRFVFALAVFLGLLSDVESGDKPHAVQKSLYDPCEAATVPAGPALELPSPVIALQVLAPARTAAGEELAYRIIADNRSHAAAHHVIIRNPLPGNAQFVRANPEPSGTGADLHWRLGTMEPGAKREIALLLRPTGPGDIKTCARVTFEHGVCVTTTVCAPPAGALRVSKRGSTDAQIGDRLTYQVTVINTGDGPAQNVVLTDTLPDGLEHRSGQKQLRYTIGTLAPGESKVADYEVVVRARGRLCNKAVATADGGLREEVEMCVNVTEAKLALAKTGPQRVYVNSTIIYKITATNEGSGPVTNLVLSDRLPEQASFLSVSDGGQLVGRQVQWSLGTLAPGASRSVELSIKSQAAGSLLNQAEATADRGLRAIAEARTEVLGVAALLLEVVDHPDPVEVGTDTRYNIIVRNTGSAQATNVRITANVPPEIAVIRVVGPVDFAKEDLKTGQRVQFRPAIIPPNKDTVFQVFCRGLKPASVRFRVEMTADQLPAGAVLEEESTNVYSGNNGGAQRRTAPSVRVRRG